MARVIPSALALLVPAFLSVAVGLTCGQTPPAEPDLSAAAEEFKIQTRTLGLRSDSPRRSQGGAGAKLKYHGRLTYNFRNDFLDATPHEVVQRGGTKNILRRNQFGFNVSGPVYIPKLFDGSRSTFLSVSYEGVREKIGRSYLRTVAIVPERTGDFSQTVDSAGNPLRIYDPQTTRPNPGYNPSLPVSEENLEFLRDTFPNDRMPTSRLDPVAQKFLEYYPLPNSDAGPFFRNNYFVFNPENNTANGMIFKLDHSFLDKHRVSGTYSFTNGTELAARYIANAANSGPPDRLYTDRRASLEHTYTLSPQSVNTASFEVYSNISESTVDRGDFASAAGLQGIDSDVFPKIDLGPYTDMGATNPVTRNARVAYVLSEGFSHKRGKHNLRFSGLYVGYQVNTFVPTFPAGYFQFRSGLTSLPGIINTGHAFASYLLGLADYSESSIVPSPSYFRNWRGSVSAQDNWEPFTGLNFSFGVNVEWSAPRTEKYDRQSTVDLTAINPANGRPGALLFAGRDGNGRGFQETQTRYQPNVSFAWNPRGNRKSVVRGYYAMSYQSFPINNGPWSTQGFNGYPTFVSPNAQLVPAVTFAKGFPPPEFPLPDIRAEAANETPADLMDRSGRLPRYQSAGLSYEREIPGSFVLSGGLHAAWGRDTYTGNWSVRPNAINPSQLFWRDQLNFEPFRRQLRRYPQYFNFELSSLWPDGHYIREAAIVRVEKRTSQGLSLNATYTYSRQYDDYSGPYGAQDFFNRRNEWSLTAWNPPHALSFSYMYELPIGVGKPFLSYQDWRRFLLNGWSISGITTVNSGEPLAIRSQFNNTGSVLQTVRADTVPGVDAQVADQSPEQWFNPAAFRHAPDFAMGNGSRTHPTLRNPTTQNHDLSVSKRFPIDQERALEFNASGFNFINNANWNDPDVIIGPESAPNVNAGRIIGSRGGRVIQLGLRLSF